MGQVYRARDTRLNRTVAVKVLSRALAADPQFRARFEREAQAVAALSHPHICTLYDVGHQDDVDFLVLEYLDGERFRSGWSAARCHSIRRSRARSRSRVRSTPRIGAVSCIAI
jgi:serine/threonine protein kinase